MALVRTYSLLQNSKSEVRYSHEMDLWDLAVRSTTMSDQKMCTLLDLGSG